MDIWVSQGPDFHAGDELRGWLRRRIDRTHSAAVIGCVHELLDIREDGFAQRRPFWRREGFTEVWSFQSFDFAIAATVAGDGRAETRDVCLVASDRIEGNGAGRDMAWRFFVDIVRDRLAAGTKVRWEL